LDPKEEIVPTPSHPNLQAPAKAGPNQNPKQNPKRSPSPTTAPAPRPCWKASPPDDRWRASGERYVVQVGAFADADKARETRLKVERAGLKTYTHVVETKDGKRIRVRVGPFAMPRPRPTARLKRSRGSICPPPFSPCRQGHGDFGLGFSGGVGGFVGAGRLARAGV
jgi:cell division septation protein DedD